MGLRRASSGFEDEYIQGDGWSLKRADEGLLHHRDVRTSYISRRGVETKGFKKKRLVGSAACAWTLRAQADITSSTGGPWRKRQTHVAN